MNLREYWDRRIGQNGRYTSVGDIGLAEPVNKYRKESLFRGIDISLEDLNFSLKDKRILDAGCGTGIYSQFYSQKGGEVFGFDFSREAVKDVKARRVPGHWIIASLSRIPFEDSFFDLTHCFSVLYHIMNDSEWRKALEEFCRVTKVGGLLLLRTEWVTEKKQFGSHQKYRRNVDYLEILDPMFDLIKVISIKDRPKYSRITNRIPRICVALRLFNENQTEKLLIFRKRADT